MPEYRIDDAGAKLILAFEGAVMHVYKDVAAIETVCIGHVVRPEDRVWLKDGVTRAECESVLRRDVRRFEDAINRLVKVKLSQPMVNALCSLVFNIGVGAFESSSVLRELNAGRYAQASDAFLLWKFAKVKQKDGTFQKKPVLLGRREAEAKLFRSGILEVHGFGPNDDIPLDVLLKSAQASLFDLRGLLDDRGLPVEDTDELTEDGRLVALPPSEEEPVVALS